MFLVHPVSLAISLASALVYAVYLNGRRAVRFSLLYMLPMMVVAALVNPAFNHEGATILTYLPSGNPLTLESILYGAAVAAMLAAVVTWFSCYTAVPIRARYSGPLSRPEYDTALCTKIPSAASGRIRGPTVYWPGCL